MKKTARGKRKTRKQSDLFIDPSGQLELVEKSPEQVALEDRRVECLGMTFESDDARRAHFTERLREKLQDPEFRKTPGFPKGTDEDILRMSDPPYYTACPNPFLADFVRAYGRPFDPAEPYRREPFAVDVSVGKTDPIYKAHAYHTKVPHLAIVPSILHYTKPGDIVLDGFCGSGMTGVAAQWCGVAQKNFRQELEAEWRDKGRAKPEWGARRVILGDLSPAATLISAGLNLPFDVQAFAREAQRILTEVESELGWMYETDHPKSKRKGRIEYTVWSEIFSCPECGRKVNFVEEALDEETKRVAEEFPCPHCSVALTKDSLQHTFETRVDPATRAPWKRIRLEPVLIRYTLDGSTMEKRPDEQDRRRLARIEALPLPPETPTNRFPIETMYHGSRIEPKGFTHVHHFFLPRQAQALAALWRRAAGVRDAGLRRAMVFFVEQAIWGMSVLARYAPTHFSQVNQYLNGVYYVGSQIVDVAPWYILSGKLERLLRCFDEVRDFAARDSITATGDCAHIQLAECSVDYVFTDPPFGKNIYYADLNYLVESWHRVLTDAAPEAIVDSAKDKGTHEYQDLMRRCFEVYYRVLKPGRWMTVVFSNSWNAIWRAIQEAIGTAGFVIADVHTLDKQQGSFRQVTSSAVKQDLVISAYKPSAQVQQKFELGAATAEGAWAMVTEHLRQVPVFLGAGEAGDVIAERTTQRLYDRMVAFHVQRGVAVPIALSEFLAGLEENFVERDGMHFLPDQVTEFDRRRMKVRELRQLELFVSDEASAIQWLRRELAEKPRTYQELNPEFKKDLQTWSKHEQTIELSEVLRQNFLCYDGTGPIPGPIHAYLSTNFREFRNKKKEDPELVAKATDRWYVPDPNRLGDLEKLRERALLKEFDQYKDPKTKKLKEFRTEAVRAGFKAAYDAGDYATIVAVGAKLPEAVLHEDEKLLMYFDVAGMRVGDN